MNVEFACVRNSVLGMRAHAKLETGHVTEMSGCPSSALLTSSWNFFEISTCMSCFKCQTSRLIELIQVLLISKALVLRAEMSWLFFRSFGKKSKLFEVSTFEDGEDLAAVVAAASPACFDFQSKTAWYHQLKRCCRHFLVRSIEPFLLQLHCAKFLWYWMDRAIWSFFRWIAAVVSHFQTSNFHHLSQAVLGSPTKPESAKSNRLKTSVRLSICVHTHNVWTIACTCNFSIFASTRIFLAKTHAHAKRLEQTVIFLEVSYAWKFQNGNATVALLHISGLLERVWRSLEFWEIAHESAVFMGKHSVKNGTSIFWRQHSSTF